MEAEVEEDGGALIGLETLFFEPGKLSVPGEQNRRGNFAINQKES